MKITLEQLEEALLNDSSTGFCLSCGNEAYGVEPDAREYECMKCGQYDLFGAEEILIMGDYTDES
jgi:hypothetical protein